MKLGDLIKKSGYIIESDLDYNAIYIKFRFKSGYS